MARDGLSTSTVKNILEAIVSYSNTAVKVVGTGRVTAPGSCTYAAGDDSLSGYGEALVLRAAGTIAASAEATYTVTGTDTLDAPLTGTAALPAYVPIGTAIDVVTAGGTFKTLTNLTVASGKGAAGDYVELLVVPTSGTFTVLDFIQNIEIGTGQSRRPIANRYDPADHYKRTRQENRITFGELYRNQLEGLSRIEGRNVTLMFQIADDGGATYTETWILSNADISAPVSFPEGADANATARAEGTFSRKIVFS